MPRRRSGIAIILVRDASRLACRLYQIRSDTVPNRRRRTRSSVTVLRQAFRRPTEAGGETLPVP